MGIVSEYDKYRFIEVMIVSCAGVARSYDLPLAAMIACGAVESRFGTSDIYNATGCPFNLQKPSNYSWVNCRVFWFTTCIQTDSAGNCIKKAKAPFCYAEGDHEFDWLRDAARIWCEWVLGYPDTVGRDYALAMRNRPSDFARRLPWLGFGEKSKRAQNGEIFVQVLRKHALFERCMFE
jgi:hypothetical protein